MRVMAHPAQLDPRSELSPIEVDWELAFLRPATRKGFEYWQSLSDGRSMPGRHELRPRAMRDFLDHVNLVEVVADLHRGFDYVIGLQGPHARDVFGDMAGRRLDAIMRPVLAQRWRTSFDLSRNAAAPVRLFTRASTVGKNWLACEALLAPLGESGGRVNALFWVFASWRAE